MICVQNVVSSRSKRKTRNLWCIWEHLPYFKIIPQVMNHCTGRLSWWYSSHCVTMEMMLLWEWLFVVHHKWTLLLSRCLIGANNIDSKICTWILQHWVEFTVLWLIMNAHSESEYLRKCSAGYKREKWLQIFLRNHVRDILRI